MSIQAAARVAGLRVLDDTTGLVETRLDLLDEDGRLIACGAASTIWAR